MWWERCTAENLLLRLLWFLSDINWSILRWIDTLYDNVTLPFCGDTKTIYTVGMKFNNSIAFLRTLIFCGKLGWWYISIRYPRLILKDRYQCLGHCNIPSQLLFVSSHYGRVGWRFILGIGDTSVLYNWRWFIFYWTYDSELWKYDCPYTGVPTCKTLCRCCV